MTRNFVMRRINARGNGWSSGNWMVALLTSYPASSLRNARMAEGVGKKPMWRLNPPHITRMRSCENASTPH